MRALLARDPQWMGTAYVLTLAGALMTHPDSSALWLEHALWRTSQMHDWQRSEMHLRTAFQVLLNPFESGPF